MQVNLSQKTLTLSTKGRELMPGETKRQHIVLYIMDENGERIGVGDCAPIEGISIDRYNMMSEVASLLNKALDGKQNCSDVLARHPALLFALESAMYDYQKNAVLYDTPFALSMVGIPVNGVIVASHYDNMLEQAKRLLLQGFVAFKIKLCNVKFFDDLIKLLQTLRSRYRKGHLELRIDACGIFEAGEALEKLQQLADAGADMIEQPLKRYQWKSMAKLCSDSPVDIVLGDELCGVVTQEEKKALLDTVRPQHIAIRPTMHGGITGAIEWAHLAQQRGIGHWLSSSMESNVGMRNIALLAGRLSPKTIHDIDTGLLFTDNIEMDVELRRGKLWRCEVSE